MKCKSIIEIEKELRKEKHEKKKRPFVPVATPGTKGHPLLSRTGVPGWETGTTAVSQPGQINIFVVVVICKEELFDSFTKVHYDLPQILRQRYSKHDTLGCFTGLLAW